MDESSQAIIAWKIARSTPSSRETVWSWCRARDAQDVKKPTRQKIIPVPTGQSGLTIKLSAYRLIARGLAI